LCGVHRRRSPSSKVTTASSGLTDADLVAIRSADRDGLPIDRQLLLEATTEIVRHHRVSDEHRTRLASEFDPAQGCVPTSMYT
jgi:hypothetical protein